MNRNFCCESYVSQCQKNPQWVLCRLTTFFSYSQKNLSCYITNVGYKKALSKQQRVSSFHKFNGMAIHNVRSDSSLSLFFLRGLFACFPTTVQLLRKIMRRGFILCTKSTRLSMFLSNKCFVSAYIQKLAVLQFGNLLVQFGRRFSGNAYDIIYNMILVIFTFQKKTLHKVLFNPRRRWRKLS